MKLQNKTTLITGASAGIGKSCAYKFAEEGSNLVLFARRTDMLESVAKDIESKYGVKVFYSKLDVRNFDEVKTMIDLLPEEFSTIDILINNAGKALGLSKFYDADLEDWEEMIDTNIKGLLYLSRVVVPKMVAQNSGFIINIGSLAGHEVYPNGNVYCGTKSFVRAISKGMIIDLNGTNVKVTNIDPGLVETEFSEVRFHGDKEKAKGIYLGYTPLKGDDIAEIAIFAATRPAHVQIQEIFVTPTDQATATIVNKKM
jgi:NADP-dependent 3-hydroxy acid dehydrogenase YdfG